jgi:Fic family protein
MFYDMIYPLNKINKIKKELDLARPFPKEVVDNLEKWFEVELTYSSNAIEGNTLTRLETALVIEKGLTVGGKPLKDHLEAINHRNALQFIKNLANNSSISLKEILSIHGLILKAIDDDNSGRIRNVAVRISGSMVVLPNYVKVPQLLEEFIDWLENSEEHPVTKAALAHYKLVTIHPFIDGNGRTARLLMNLILIQNGYPPAIILPKDRLKYIKSLEKGQLGGSIDDYLGVIYQAVYHSIQIYVKALNKQLPTEIESSNILLKIGALAKEAGESIATIRYWTKLGLIEVSTTTASGYQLYDRAMVETCKKIRELQANRYSLEEIIEIMYKNQQ